MLGTTPTSGILLYINKQTTNKQQNQHINKQNKKFKIIVRSQTRQAERALSNDISNIAKCAQSHGRLDQHRRQTRDTQTLNTHFTKAPHQRALDTNPNGFGSCRGSRTTRQGTHFNCRRSQTRPQPNTVHVHSSAKSTDREHNCLGDIPYFNSR